MVTVAAAWMSSRSVAVGQSDQSRRVPRLNSEGRAEFDASLEEGKEKTRLEFGVLLFLSLLFPRPLSQSQLYIAASSRVSFSSFLSPRFFFLFASSLSSPTNAIVCNLLATPLVVVVQIETVTSHRALYTYLLTYLGAR